MKTKINKTKIFGNGVQKQTGSIPNSIHKQKEKKNIHIQMRKWESLSKENTKSNASFEMMFNNSFLLYGTFRFTENGTLYHPDLIFVFKFLV